MLVVYITTKETADGAEFVEGLFISSRCCLQRQPPKPERAETSMDG